MPMNKADAARQKLLSGLGLCAKARALTFGTPMVCESLREKNKPHLVLEASDTSAATHKKISDKCNFYQVQHVRLPVTGEELAAAIASGIVSQAKNSASLIQRMAEPDAPELWIIRWQDGDKEYQNHVFTGKVSWDVMRKWARILVGETGMRGVNEL